MTPQDVATAVRETLREAFPTTTFSVRTHVYADGWSVRVGWTDGPTQEEVAARLSAVRDSEHIALDRFNSAHDTVARAELDARLDTQEQEGVTSVSVPTAAYLLEMSHEAVTQALRSGDMVGVHDDRGRWVISLASVRAYQARRPTKKGEK